MVLALKRDEQHEAEEQEANSKGHDRSFRGVPSGLRRRRGSLHYKRTGSLAEVAEFLGDSKRVAADHYVYALTDYREVDRSIALARAKAV